MSLLGSPLCDPLDPFPARNRLAGSNAAIQGESQLRLCIDAVAGVLLLTGISARAFGGVGESRGVLMLGFGWDDGFESSLFQAGHPIGKCDSRMNYPIR